MTNATQVVGIHCSPDAPSLREAGRQPTPLATDLAPFQFVLGLARKERCLITHPPSIIRRRRRKSLIATMSVAPRRESSRRPGRLGWLRRVLAARPSYEAIIIISSTLGINDFRTHEQSTEPSRR